MGTGAITSYIDVAQLVLYLFWIFFFGLIYYLMREGQREGYPMDPDGPSPIEGWPRAPSPKIYLLADGREIQIPRESEPDAAAQRRARLQDLGCAAGAHRATRCTAGVGPGSWSALRPDVADLDHHGQPKIVPLSMAPEFGVSDATPTRAAWRSTTPTATRPAPSATCGSTAAK